MSALSVAAVVVSHGRPDYLKASLSALSAQSLRPKHVIVVETAADLESMELVRAAGFQLITPGNIQFGAAVNAAIDALPKDFGWLWLLHEDAVAEISALEQLGKAAEISPSVAIIGPKLLHFDDPGRIQQLGLTATRTGKPFLLVADEYDQGQHDALADVLATSTAGMLIALEAWHRLGGVQDSTPLFASDLELGIRARAAGYRVMVEPSARVLHAGLSLAGMREKSWLGGSRYVARAKAHIHTATTLWPLPFVLSLYFFMPLIALVSIPFHLWTKRPGRILGQLRGWLWAWGTLSQRLQARSITRGLGSLAPVANLLATTKQIRQRKLDALIELPDEPKPPNGIFASNQAWFALIPLLASFPIWPQGPIITSWLLPLSADLGEIFAQTGASGLQSGSGLAAPTDPFNWVLLALAAISPLGSDWAVSLWLFLGPTLGYFVAWQFAAAFVQKPWLRTLVGLGFSLSPFVLGAALGANLVSLTAALFAPLALLFALRSMQSHTNARALRWSGLSAISLFGLSVSSPSLAMVASLYFVVLGLVNPRRLHLQLLALVPSVLVLYPWVQFWFEKGSMQLALIPAWSALPALSIELANWSVYFLGSSFLLLIGLAAAKTGRWLAGLALILGLLAVSYFEVSSQLAQLGVATLIALVLAVSGISQINKPVAVATGLVFALFVGFAGWQSVSTERLDARESRLMPALVVAQSKANQGDVLTLKLSQGDNLEAELVWGDGLQLEQRAVASKYLEPELPAQQIAQLSAGLIAGNSDGIQALIQELGISFILLNSTDPQTQAQTEVAIGSMEFLQPAGRSEFGALWRTEVVSAVAPNSTPQPLRQELIWSLAVAGLLALPTPAVVRGYRRSRRSER
ncbi:glycosyltransferase family 2 protein [Aquiluna sp. KACHI24]|uniref:glycosyltransferase family 2 protein n=1 Tax=Aquiluna sp. KACHI24 TaxID=2968831 RepID=UPI00220BD4CE|nr:glycosyltransferase family 2 protein [Aquiluna sp. KACHI24]BDP99946.1 hypothetical protein AKACHI_02830 [Aquiluna sp. KACHI24]